MAERTRAELTGAIRDFDSLFQGRIKLTPEGTVTHEGRTAWRYVVTLAPAAQAEASRPLPPMPQAKKGARTRRRSAGPTSSPIACRARWTARCWWIPPPPWSSRPGWTGAWVCPGTRRPRRPSCA
ncbi:hypothetical protein QEG98_07895 [Myxococcus sp. MxC21-1]|uniref:hypothetical protein n=1 Tax=Myxococcus sp. MxC21-1 TaxID=3041439 RepID=UPI00293194A2|nr:hypothetical protein [Myxococcus sp. MxC21-1]WNZ63629.1 hypothetical protein QEG98_07895 [Myxococcus sp. MxC21-1]